MNEVQFSADDVARMLQINHLAVHQLSEKGVLKVVRSSNGTEYYRAEDLYHFVMEHVFLGPNLRVHGDNILDDQVLRFIILGEHYQMLVSVCFWCTAKGKKSEVVKLLYALPSLFLCCAAGLPPHSRSLSGEKNLAAGETAGVHHAA
jgi:hypothetical protein